jgi:DNA-directed RNA polymerase subunit RPC12/RpoP
MEVFYCESCGKRLTDDDLASGDARDKKARGLHCQACAAKVITTDYPASRQTGPVRTPPAGQVTGGSARGRPGRTARRTPTPPATSLTGAFQAARTGNPAAFFGLIIAAVALAGAALFLFRPNVRREPMSKAAPGQTGQTESAEEKPPDNGGKTATPPAR